MKKHTITVGELLDWLSTEPSIIFASASGKKKLCATVTGEYLVYNRKEIVYHGNNPDEAVEIYNSI